MRYITFAALGVSLLLSCVGGGSKTTGNVVAVKKASDSGSSTPKQYTYTIKKVFPHSIESYTQGLYWHNGFLYEGTGLNGESALKKVDLESGRVLEAKALDKSYFGEGIVLHNDKIYQLTWQNGIAVVYDSATLQKMGEKRYSGEGWGLASDGNTLYMSDGSDKIYIVNPDTFEKISTISVKANGNRVSFLNEMEWIDGKIWANVYMSDFIVMIDPATGNVDGILDLEGILPPSDVSSDTDVLNGIAYDAERKRIFVTGKKWNKLFEIEIIEK